MDSNDGIAVVITCFDLGRTLGDAVASAMAQTRRPAEIIVADDGSTDEYTRAVLGSFDSDVTVLRLEHAGPAVARNRGIEESTAPLVVLLDGDDMFAPTYLEKAGEFLTARPELSFVSCGLQAFGEASYRWTPPVYTVTQSIARGACGHIATVFRRGVWESVGGFDPTLPAYEDLDFWLTALERGYLGEIIDEPLVRYRVRRGSRYHHAISPAVYGEAKHAILGKHRDSVETEGADMLGLMLEFEAEVRGHRDGLVREAGEAAEETRHLRQEISEAIARVAELGEPSLGWGTSGDALTSPPAGIRHVHDRYAKLFLKRRPRVKKNRGLVVRSPEELPEPGRRLELIVLLDVLSRVADPRRCLELCRDALKPDGTLLAVFSCLPLDAEQDLRVFTEASVRALACDVFDPAAVEVVVYGNLLAAMASVARVELGLEELLPTDPTHPVTIGLSATVKPRPRDSAPAPGPQRNGSRPIDGNPGAVLVYHRVAEFSRDPHGLCVAPREFRVQMETIVRDFVPISLRALAEGAITGELAERAVAVTFDDGYLDNLQVASPILAELGIPATFFVCTERLEEKHEHWWDVVERVLCDGSQAQDVLSIRTDVTRMTLPAGSSAEREAAVMALHGILLNADAEERNAVLEQLVAWGGAELPARDSHRAMVATELVELAARTGHELGAHTTHHLMLTAHSEDVRRAELLESKRTLEDITGSPVDAVSYPYGAADLVTTCVAEDMGFRTGWSVDGDAVGPYRDPLRLPRLDSARIEPALFGDTLERVLAT